ncbi:MAG: hypothetical protein R3E39_25045 [Anaerolineae bacterium]
MSRTFSPIRVNPESPNVLGRMLRGAHFNVIGGPICGPISQLWWWQVDFNGVVGWATEGQNNEYWLAPVGEVTTLQPTAPPTPDAVVSTLPPPTPEPLNSNGVPSSFQPICRLLTAESFDGDIAVNSWREDTTPNGSVSIRNGAYEITIEPDSNAPGNQPIVVGGLLDQSFGNVRVEALIRSSVFASGEDRTGLLFRGQDDQSFLAFIIRSDGSFRVVRVISGGLDSEGKVLVDWTPSDAIRLGNGEANTLRIDMRGSRIELYINRQLVARLTEDEWREGRVGFFGASWEEATFSLDYIRFCGNP